MIGGSQDDVQGGLARCVRVIMRPSYWCVTAQAAMRDSQS